MADTEFELIDETDEADDFVQVPGTKKPERSEDPEPEDNNDDRSLKLEDDDVSGAEDEAEDGSDFDRELERKREYRRNLRRKKRRIADERLEIIATQQQVINEQNARLAALENRTVQDDEYRAEANLRQALSDVTRAEVAFKQAVVNMDPDTQWRAQALREDAMRRVGYFRDLKQRIVLAQQEMRRRQTQPSPDPAVRSYGNEFLRRNAWINLQGGDEDSEIALALDKALTAQGRDPKSQDYWDELEDKLRDRLPHRYRNDGDEAQPKRRGPPVGGRGETRSSGTRLGPNQVRITPERKKALQELGVWGNMKEMKPYLEEYAAYDRAHRS